MEPSHGSLLYEGKAKRVFETNNPDELLVHFKNDATAFNAKKHSQLDGKGMLNCKISSSIFRYLGKEGVPTHFLDEIQDCWMLARKVEVIPLEIVVRNIASGSLCRETPIVDGTELSSPLIDFYYKDDRLGDPLLTEKRVLLLGLLSSSQILEIETLSLMVNTFLKKFFIGLDLLLVDFKLEMGLARNGKLLVADEISPDTCRIWDRNIEDKQDRILDKDRFRNDLGGVMEGYSEVFRRINEAYS